jgi:hypothetical protein
MTVRAALHGKRLPIIGLGLVAIALSLVLIPQGRELALLRMEAGDTQRAVAILEAKVAAGDRSPATIATLARALASAGDAVGAARLLEELVAERPRDRAVLEALAGFQRIAGRNDRLIRTLETLQSITPRASRQRELAKLYAASGRQAEQLTALRGLVAQRVAEPDEYLSLARLEASMGRPIVGATVLRSLGVHHPNTVDASIVGLELRMLLAGGEADQALARSRQWLEGRRDLAESGPILAGSLSVGGHPDLAVALLQRYADAGADPRLVAALSQAESDAGDAGAGLSRLERLDIAGGARSGEQVALLRLRLALAVGDTDRALAAGERLGWPAVPDELLQALSAIALNAGRTDALRRLAELGEKPLASAPVLAAQLRLALGDRKGAQRWSDLATETVIGRPELAVRLAEVELQLGRNARVAALLLGAVPAPDLPPAALRAVASLFIRAGLAEQGAAALDALRHDRPSTAADLAWALAATAAGRTADVGAWLSAAGREELPADLLLDLVHLAADAGARVLALQLGERLVATRGSAEHILLLARLLFDAGQPGRALERLRTLPAGTTVPEAFRAAVLLGAWRQGAPVAEQLRAVWRQRLNAAASPAERDAAISFLLELRAHAELLPLLRALAASAPERWLGTYGDAAAAAGRRGDAIALWAELANREDLSAELRRQLAFRLLEAGDKRAAERAFRGLASVAPADSPDVRQLLYLWGPRPGPEQLDWIEARGRQASGPEEGVWMRILIDRNAAARAIAIYRAKARGDAPEAVLEAYLAALETQDDRAAMAAAVREALPRARAAGPLQRLARLAARAGDTTLERQALERLVMIGGSGPDTQRRLGTLAYLRRDRDAAQQLLSAFVAATGGDYETWMILGDIASWRRDTVGARQHYAESLRRLEASEERSFRSRVVRANLLHRLGRDTEATQLYGDLLAERPVDQNLRADYAAMLMEQGALRRARELLVGR